MRNALLKGLCIATAILWVTTAAEAGWITWEFLMHSSVAGKSPGPDGLIGTSDDTSSSGERSACNFTQETDCHVAGSPTVGAYSFAAIEIAAGVVNSCLFGEAQGQPCISGPCSPLGDYCPGDNAFCIPCPQRGQAPDAFTYLGTEGVWPDDEAQMFVCQEYDGPQDPDPSDTGGQTEFMISSLEVHITDPFLGMSGGGLSLSYYDTPEHFLGGPCGVSATVSGSFDAYVWGAYPDAFAMPFSGDVIDMDNPTAASCGYGLSDINTMITNARASYPEAEYLMILCGTATIPTDSTLTCLAGGALDFVFVLFTTDDASQCPDNGCGIP